jgi:hypothetical protein
VTYSIRINGHAEHATPEEIETEARKLVGALDGVQGAMLSDERGAVDLMAEVKT